MCVRYEHHRPHSLVLRYSIEELGRLAGLLAKRAVHAPIIDARRDIGDARAYIEFMVAYLDELEGSLRDDYEKNI